LAIVVVLGAVACSAPVQKHAENARGPLANVEALFARGEMFAQAGDHTRAEQYFAAAIDAGGKPSAILPHLLKACVASGHLRLASEYAEAELQRSPNNARLRFVSGALRAQLGDGPLAREHLVRAATDLPNDPSVQFSVAAFFRDTMVDRVNADPYFRHYLELAPKGEHADEARASLMERIQ
jgi:tetratricopeptide (TPR) repeat protein